MDPTSRGEGGAAALQNAGVDVEVGVLDDETRLVLAPWLAALEGKRPFVTLGYTVDADGRIGGLASSSLTSTREVAMDVHNLRLIHDAVLRDDDRLEESAPGGHGRGVFALPTDTPPEASDLLASLVDGGVRSLLVDGGSSLASSFLEAGLIDQAVTYIESGGPSSSRQPAVDTRHFAGLLRGFALREVTRVNQTVRVSSARRR
jgi:diaminohydroxyphosphoribosylaminopyrimidine deaminase/5-amino-6-(5-phosphoribosylamino)uracil reductase